MQSGSMNEILRVIISNEWWRCRVVGMAAVLAPAWGVPWPAAAGACTAHEAGNTSHAATQASAGSQAAATAMATLRRTCTMASRAPGPPRPGVPDDHPAFVALREQHAVFPCSPCRTQFSMYACLIAMYASAMDWPGS